VAGETPNSRETANHQKADLTDLIEAHHRVALETEERISESRWMIAQSRRFLQIRDASKSAAK
jgi:hypothetical protein